MSHLHTRAHAKKVNSELRLTVLQTADSKSRGGPAFALTEGKATVVLTLSRRRSVSHTSFFTVSRTRKVRRQIDCFLQCIYNCAARKETCLSFGSSFSSFLNTFLEQLLLSPGQIFSPASSIDSMGTATLVHAKPMKRTKICHRAIPTCAGIRWRQMSSGNRRHVVPRANTQSK